MTEIKVITAVVNGIPDELQDATYPASEVAGWLGQTGDRSVEVEDADADAVEAALVEQGATFQLEGSRFSATNAEDGPRG